MDIKSSINTFGVQKEMFLNDARKNLFEIQKDGIRLDNDGIIDLLGSAFSFGWASAKLDTRNTIIGVLSGQIKVGPLKGGAV